MKPDLFTLEVGRFYAWQMFPGYGEAPYCSPIRVDAVKPLKRGDGRFDLTFWNGFYAEGVQGMTYGLRTVHRTPTHLVAEVLGGDRTVVISRFSDEWAHRYGRGYTEELLHNLLGGSHAPLMLDQVEFGVYVGPFPDETHVPYLQQLGIEAILSVVDEQDPHPVSDRIRTSFEWAQVPVRDSYWKGIPTVEDLADAVAVLREWKAKGLKRFYIHCLAGQGRSPLMAIAYMVNGAHGTNGMRLTKAIAQVSARRPDADPNVHQLRVLTEYVDRALHDPQFHPEHYQCSARVIRHRAAAALESTVPVAGGSSFQQLRDRYRGAMIGLAVGDVLGVPLEFKAPGEFKHVSEVLGGGPFQLQPGEWTDDTSMALCLAESLISREGFDARDQLERYVRWWKDGHLSSTGHCFDIGSTVRAALGEFSRTGSFDVGQTHAQSAGNGSLMRLAPVPLFYGQNPHEAISRAAESSRTTHAHPEAVDACRYFAGLMVGALRGATKAELLAPRYCPDPGAYDSEPLCPAIDAVALGSFKTKQPPEIQGRGHVVRALEAALWAFHHGKNFDEGCRLAVNLGHDADTTGAIYGQLAGAYYGEAAIPERWRAKLVDAHRIAWFAEALLVSALRPTMPLMKQPFFSRLNGETLVASDDPRSADVLAEDLGDGLFLDLERLVQKPSDARFDITDCCVETPQPATCLFVPELSEDDL